MKLFTLLLLLLTGNAFADIILNPGEMSWVGEERVYCSGETQAPQMFNCKAKCFSHLGYNQEISVYVKHRTRAQERLKEICQNTRVSNPSGWRWGKEIRYLKCEIED